MCIRDRRDAILDGGWKNSKYDECMYYHRAEDGRIAVRVTYVDDILLVGDWEDEVQRMVSHLLKRYEGRDLGVPDKLIGIALTATNEGIKLDRTLYAKSIMIDGMGSTDVRKVFTPLDPGMDLSPRQENEEEIASSSLPCARILGKLMFLAGMTRLDIACSVRELSRRVASPSVSYTHLTLPTIYPV